MKKIIFILLSFLFSSNLFGQNGTPVSTPNTTTKQFYIYILKSGTLPIDSKKVLIVNDSSNIHINMSRIYFDSLRGNININNPYYFLNIDTSNGQLGVSRWNTIPIDWSNITNKPSIGTGTVTSVGISSSDLTISGSPVATSGSITLGINNSVSADTYSSVTVNNKGLVTAGTNTPGLISSYAGTSAPIGYLLCDGTAVSRTTYAGLFAITGTIYGSGDGSTTFNIPDLRQRFPLGKSTSGTGSTLGSSGGQIDHIHTVNPPNTTTGTPSGTSGQLVGVINVASSTHTHDVDIAQFNSGGNNPPFLTINYIIKY